MNIIRKHILFVANNLFSILIPYVFVASLLSYTFFIDVSINYKNLIFTLILSLISFEILFRMLLFLSFGNNYKSIINSNFLEDHKRYGFTFKSNQSSINNYENSFLFDRFLFNESHSVSLNSLSENKKNRSNFNSNSLCFRGREFTKKKKDKDKIRIFCTGGSTTAGSTDDNKTWPYLLEKKLKDMKLNVEVINAGVYGWYSAQELIRFKDEIINYDIDVLLIHQGWNEEFNYSSLDLGNKWYPGQIRGLKESNIFYLDKLPFLSKVPLITLFFILKNFFTRRRLKKMSFLSYKRWEVLTRNEYLLAWFDNIIEFAKMSDEKNILCYAIDYPTLADIDYTKKNSEFIKSKINRLDNEFINYQSISKLRITNFLKQLSSIITVIDAKEKFSSMSLENKIDYFHDEMHTNEHGNDLIADQIAKKLVKDNFFTERIKKVNSQSNISSRLQDKDLIKNIRKQIATNPQYIVRYLEKKIIEMKKSQYQSNKYNLPSNRYTTF